MYASMCMSPNPTQKLYVRTDAQTRTHLLRTVIANFVAECIGRTESTKTTNTQYTMYDLFNLYNIYIYMTYIIYNIDNLQIS